jgi:zinc/manganese transport system permease protein
MNPVLSANPIYDLRELLVFPFMVNALEAGTTVAVLAAVVGWYVVLRGQTFASHTLSVMAFPGATGAALARPLLFSSIDADVARAGGVPVRLIDVAFLLILGLAIAATSQLTGALLVFALLVAPAASAQLITARPVAGLALSVAIALVVVWLGLAIAYFTIYPVGFYVTSLAFAIYVAARIVTGRRG